MLAITALAVPVGAVSALVAWCLVKLIGIITNAVFYQRFETTLVAPGATHHPWWLILVAPVAGGLIVGLMARYGSERIRGHGMPETIEAILMNGSKIQPRVALLKPISAAFSIGSGGPFGAEGPIIMTGGAVGSIFAQLLKLTTDERKTLLVAGSTAGMAAVFNAPLASVALAIELLLFEWRPRSVVPVVAAVATAVVVRHPILGEQALFPAAGPLHLTASTYVLCAVAGVVSAVVAVLATYLVYASEDTFHRLPIHWMWWPAIGGVVIGLGGLVVPQALGVGYDVIGAALTGSISLGLAGGVLVVKTLIWSLSLGSGTSGGVLAPLLLIGGTLGAVESHVLPTVGPGFWALVGLASMLGAAMRVPLTATIFGLELTGQWSGLLPLLIAAFAGYAVSVLVLKRSILTEKIARRGYHLSREYDVDPLEIVFVSEVMLTEVLELDSGLSTRQARAALDSPDDDWAAWRQQLYPVVGADQRMLGVVTRGSLLSADAADTDRSIDEVLIEQPTVTHADQTLRNVAELMATTGLATLPVVDRYDETRIVGIVSLRQLLEGRRRDQQEQRERERMLRFRRVVSTQR
ncbi:MAG: chloride channel protein [Actinomycetota bacterium]|nr:chloride channel protein [Actinomycetota bacterium]